MTAGVLLGRTALTEDLRRWAVNAVASTPAHLVGSKSSCKTAGEAIAGSAGQGLDTVCRPCPVVVFDWDSSWFEPSRTSGRLVDREPRVLTETGAVRVSWDREQLIGGQPIEARK
ncbi:hypothetical protein C8258_04455 [Nocardia sp. MDA0666]|nr:hypothetical protein C8258_04455 [Nocardia sp. MDA0666]